MAKNSLDDGSLDISLEIDVLIKLRWKCEEVGVPEEEVESLFSRAVTATKDSPELFSLAVRGIREVLQQYINNGG